MIIITGTPGTGKTSIARELAKRLNAVHIDLSRYVIEEDYIQIMTLIVQVL